MQLRYFQNIIPPVDGMQKISAIAWCSDGKKLAVCSADRIVHLFDEQGNKKDKFPTKPSDKGQKSYIIRAMEFSPDSQRIALAQSDNIVFIYKIGTEWGEKKSICNKFPVSSSVTCMVWPKERPNDLVFGLAEGKVRNGVLRSNKSQVLYQTESYCVSIASNRVGDSVISGHLDGSIFAYHLESQTAQKVVVHHSIPYALGWGEQIVAGGNDQKVSFYDTFGNLLQRFDYTNDEKVREFTVAAFNPSGETVVLGNFNRFYTYNYNQKRTQWEEIGVQNIENYYTVTALCWKNDGSKLVTGSLCGSFDLYDASMKKIKYKGKFELNYVSPSQIVVKTLITGNKSMVRSNYSLEISKINIFQDRYVVANTHDTIIMCDLEQNKTSEIQWRGSGKEKYDFSNPNVCMIFNAGELTLVEYGNNESLGTCRTEHMKSNLISARLNYTKDKGNKMIAYLLDLQTICIQDLSLSTTVAQINHDSKIDFLELNTNANKLLFRDKRRQLYLYNIKNQTKNTLLSYCTYAQWVPSSEVVVAQNRNNLCVWYSIENPDKVTIYNIKGDIEEIERTAGKTEVIVNDGNNTVAYSLDEPLIEFGFAVESSDLEKAAGILDPLEMNPESEANWKILAKIAIEEQNISVAEHCYAALGDISKSTYLRKVNKIIKTYEKETGKTDGMQFYKVQAKLAVLDKQFHRAESILLDHNNVEEVMEMYQELHKWDESIKIAEKKNHPDVMELKANYFQWLMDTNQEEKAGEVKENEGDFLGAINLYLKGGLPARASNVVFNYNISFPQDILEKIATSLNNGGIYERAGEFYEQMENLQKALDCYCKGNAYKKAVDLAKKAEPRIVVQLEEKWGDYLVQTKQTESAINHYIEAGQFQKAIEAAISARQWNKAIQLLQHQTPEIARPFYRQIAKHYADVRQYDFAEKYFIKSGLPIDAFEMYAKAAKWEKALQVVRENLPESEIVMLYVKQAQKFEEQNLLKEAEKLYLTVDEPDLAINMYKKVGQYELMMKLVSKYRPNLLKDAQLSIAQRVEREGNYKVAEQYYIEAKAWQGAVEMYKSHGMWEDAVRCCKLYGTDKETCELAKMWAETLGPDQGMKMLLKLNLVDAVIEYLSDRNEFDEAFKMAKQNAKHKIGDVNLKYAFFLEDEKRYKEAEEQFIKAGKPGEAINMYEHQGDFHSALQVARQYDPSTVPGILMNQAKLFIQKNEYQKAEQCFVNGKKPELAIKMYTDLGNFPEALRVAKKHAPHLVNEINSKYMNSAQQGQGQMSGDDLLQSAKLWEENRDWLRAIDTYLEIKQEHYSDPNILIEAWERAVQLAMNYDKERVIEIVRTVGKRLRDIGRFENAGYGFEMVGLYEESVACYIQAQNFNRARDCAQQVRNKDLYNKLFAFIDKSEQGHLRGQGKAIDMVERGNVDEGLQMLATSNQWSECLQLAEKSGGEILSKYLIKFAKVTMESGRFGETIAAFAKYNMQPVSQNYPIYKTLALEIFVECDQKEIMNLRISLFNFYKLLEHTGENKGNAGIEFYRYLMVAHLLNLKAIYEKKDMHQLLSKISISVLRYCDLVRLDKLYYDAGVACQRSNNLSFAFMLLNRYLDIYEVIEDPDNNNLSDNSDFTHTDIPSPFDVPLPEKNIVNSQQIEKIRDWLLQISMNQKVVQELPTRACEKCGTHIYEACLKCHKCSISWEPCIITGYPLFKGSHLSCKSCGKSGLKDAWNQYLQNFVNCPWCNNPPQ